MGSGSNPLWTTTYYLNAYGQLTSAYIGDGKPRSVTYTNDELGQIIRRDETRPYNAPTAQVGSPHEVWYRSGGRTLGQTGNNGGEASDYAGSIAQRQAATPTAPGTFARGSTYAAPSADFAQSLDSITSFGHGSAGGGYTVRAGDSLSSIALGLWGDANLWYKIAEANGLSAAATLIEGQSLRLPAGVNRSSHNASTLQPYDPAEALGDLSPSAPKPPKKNKCAAVGQLFLAVVAVAVSTILLPGSGAVAFEHAVLAAVGGSVASQGVGLATGLQDKFSFKGVALAALTAGVASKLGASGVFDRIQSSVVRAGATAAASSAISQGIGLATGLQNKFSFAGVAAAGVAAGVGSALGGDRLAPLHGEGARFTAANVANHLGVGAARSLAAAATRSVIEGTSFGDNIIATLPDVLAQTVVDTVAGAVTGGGGVLRDVSIEIDAPSLADLSAVGSDAIAALGAPLFKEELAKAASTSMMAVSGPTNDDSHDQLASPVDDALDILFQSTAQSTSTSPIERGSSRQRIVALDQYLTPDERDALFIEYNRNGRRGVPGEAREAALEFAAGFSERMLQRRGLDANLLASIEIDWNFIREMEGFRTEGYVPSVGNENRAHENSGVTIGVGFDLGRKTVGQLHALHIPEAMVERLTPYLGRRGERARAYLRENPLVLTTREANTLDAVMRGQKATSVATTYNGISERRFQDLRREYQTVIASVHFQYGSITAAPNFSRQVAAGEWEAAIANLRNFGDGFSRRRGIEADLMQSGLNQSIRRPRTRG